MFKSLRNLYLHITTRITCAQLAVLAPVTRVTPVTAVSMQSTKSMRLPMACAPVAFSIAHLLVVIGVCFFLPLSIIHSSIALVMLPMLPKLAMSGLIAAIALYVLQTAAAPPSYQSYPSSGKYFLPLIPTSMPTSMPTPMPTPITLSLFISISLSILLLFPSMAHASIGEMMKNLEEDMGNWFDLLIYAAYGIGIGSTMIGIGQGIKKSTGDCRVTLGSILGYGFGGVAFCLLGYLIDNISESLGGGSDQMNKLPGGL